MTAPTATRRLLTVVAAATTGLLIGVSATTAAPAAAELYAKPKAVKLAKNADKVDGKHAVGADAAAAQRAGKLVATDGSGRLPNDIIAQAPDADRVDGLDAVGAGAGAGQRAGRLVATDGAGRLPDDIIAKAPDADRLDGIDGSALRTIPLDLGAGVPTGGTVTFVTGAFGGGGLRVPDTGTGFGWGVVLPPGFATGSPLQIRLQWHVDQTGCTVNLLPNSTAHGRVGLTPDLGDASAGLTGGGQAQVAAVAETTVETVFTAVPPRPGTVFQPGDSYQFSFFRSNNGDSCSEPVFVTGASLTW